MSLGGYGMYSHVIIPDHHLFYLVVMSRIKGCGCVGIVNETKAQGTSLLVEAWPKKIRAVYHGKQYVGSAPTNRGKGKNVSG